MRLARNRHARMPGVGVAWTVRDGPCPMEGDMAEQKRKETRPTKPAEGGGEGGAANPELAKKGKKIKEDIDKLLDEIDDILEENAEEFVKSYVQRGGE